jgi:hypothetical protein
MSGSVYRGVHTLLAAQTQNLGGELWLCEGLAPRKGDAASRGLVKDSVAPDNLHHFTGGNTPPRKL